MPGWSGGALLRDRLGDRLVEGFGIDLLVEVVDLEIHLIGQVEQVDLAGAGVDDVDLIAFVEVDARL